MAQLLNFNDVLQRINLSSMFINYLFGFLLMNIDKLNTIGKKLLLEQLEHLLLFFGNRY